MKTETGPWDSSALATLRERDSVWVDQCHKMSDSPWTGNILPHAISACRFMLKNWNASRKRREARTWSSSAPDQGNRTC